MRAYGERAELAGKGVRGAHGRMGTWAHGRGTRAGHTGGAHAYAYAYAGADACRTAQARVRAAQHKRVCRRGTREAHARYTLKLIGCRILAAR